MRLSVLSNGYISDSIADAGTIAPMSMGTPDMMAQHFRALCRGVAVLMIVTVTLGLTFLKSGPSTALDVDGTPEIGTTVR